MKWPPVLFSGSSHLGWIPFKSLVLFRLVFVEVGGTWVVLVVKNLASVTVGFGLI